jgi:hypothetical protein
MQEPSACWSEALLPVASLLPSDTSMLTTTMKNNSVVKELNAEVKSLSLNKLQKGNYKLL